MSEQRFSEEQLALILKRAAERQARTLGGGQRGYSLTDVQRIAAEAGISPAHITEAINAVSDDAPAAIGPDRFRAEQLVASTLDAAAKSDLIDLARNVTGLQGKVVSVLDSVEWSARDSLGAHFVTIGSRNGVTRITALAARTDQRALIIMGGVVLGAVAGVVLGGITASVTHIRPFTVIAACVGGTTAGVLWTKGMLLRMRRRWSGKVRELCDALARRAMGT